MKRKQTLLDYPWIFSSACRIRCPYNFHPQKLLESTRALVDIWADTLSYGPSMWLPVFPPLALAIEIGPLAVWNTLGIAWELVNHYLWLEW
jgi:hypothetical protein